MATLEQLSAALVKADAAGNTDDARAFAAEIRKMRSTVAPMNVDPTEGMSTFEKAAAGTGKAIVDTLQGAGQMLGLADRADVEETRRRDAPLMKSTAAKVGNFAGNVAMMAPAALIPGAATVPGAAAIGAGMGLIQPSTSTGETLTNVALGSAGGAAGQAVANKLPGVVSAWGQKKAAEAATLEAQNAQRFAAANKGANLGYVVPPADLNPGTITEALSGLSGKIKTAQVASQRNQGVTDTLARKAVGLNADDALSADVLQSIRQQAGAAYDAVKTAGTVTADKPFIDALDKIAATQQGAGRSFPGLQNNGVTDLVDSLKRGSFDAGDAVDATKVLREMADKAYRQGDSTLGKAAKSASDAIEGALERHLQATSPDALKGFQDARKLMAKTYTIQKALNSETGSVSAQKLAAELNKGRPLSDELRAVAEFAQAFPKASQALKETPKAISPLDFAVSGGAVMASSNPLALLMLGARPVARNALLSGPMQRAALVPSYSPSVASRVAPAAIDNELFRLLAAPAGMTAGLSMSDKSQR